MKTIRSASVRAFHEKLFLRTFLALALAIPISSSAQQGTIRVELGAEEIVFASNTQGCAQLDLPDVYAHAIRTSEGLVLGSGNAPDNYFLFGRDFNSLARSCTPVLRSGDQWPVDSFDHQEWITSMYSEDGRTIHALVHNEYHDPYARNCRQGVTDPSNPCWYNYISYAVSRDGGRTFTQPASPGHLVAMLPYKWSPAAPRGAPPPHGYFEPGNIVVHKGHYYSMLFGIVSRSNQSVRGTCIMRSSDIADPGSWKLWDGRDFTIPLVNPYAQPPADSSIFIPAFVAPGVIRDLRGSLTWNAHLGAFMLVGAGVHPVRGVETCGFFFSLSSDLLTWTQPQLIRETVLGWSPCDRQTADQTARNITQEAYPSLIDHDAPDISFTIADSTAYLYFMQNMDNHRPGGWGFRRHLVRIPIRFRTDVAAIAPLERPRVFDLRIHPNPLRDALHIETADLPAGTYRLDCRNALGMCVLSESVTIRASGESISPVQARHLPTGLYALHLIGERHTAAGRFVVVR